MARAPDPRLGPAISRVTFSDGVERFIIYPGLAWEPPKYGRASKVAGETIQSCGGLERGLKVAEAAANGQYLIQDAKVHATMNNEDPFFEAPQTMEQRISQGLFLMLFFVIVLVPLCCCCRG